jgi:hypothetical protein
MKFSMIASWSANAVWVAGERLITFTLKPFALASSAARSKKSVAVLNTPVMSGGVQPITISSSERPPPSPPPPLSSSPQAATGRAHSARAPASASRRLTITLLLL